MNRVGSWSQLASNIEVFAHFGEQRGADLLLLLSPCTESETPWTGRAETCPTPRQNEVGASPADKSAKPTLRYLCYLLFKPERLGVHFSINMPLLRSWWCPGDPVAINMPLLWSSVRSGM